MCRKMFFVVMCVFFFYVAFVSPSFATTYIAEPVLVTEPQYMGNSFYLYRPSHIPAGTLVDAGSYRGNPVLQQRPCMGISSVPVCPQTQEGLWNRDRKFLMVSLWRDLVDRMGVLHSPRLPLAWKGDRPKAIFIWLGSSWWQMHCKENETPQCTLQRNTYALTKLAKQNRFSLTPRETGSLLNYACLWGYYWMGEVYPNCRYR